jgi:hypothetical protein
MINPGHLDAPDFRDAFCDALEQVVQVKKGLGLFGCILAHSADA